ncbi:hypothetical protein M422DRAFT_782742 [Sphaerobolus stellatus SS14]|uniref:VWFA domain-containing protein n=1 Tax=Sphaerobolus stellatus (strain SS14) TaxID=990650 RepID=A0A0C9VC22_SPHS4|nr:hypothetical protein M422DRAFT_782742 [Sphaerobolus stellatus SS14]
MSSRCHPSQHERCGGLVAVIVVGVVLGLSLILVLFNFLFRTLRRRRRERAIATKLESDTEALKDFGKDGGIRRSRYGLGMSFASDAATCATDRPNVGSANGDGDTLYPAVQDSITLIRASSEFREVVGKISRIPMLSSEAEVTPPARPSSSPVSPAIPLKSEQEPQLDTPNSIKTQDRENIVIPVVSARPRRGQDIERPSMTSILQVASGSEKVQSGDGRLRSSGPGPICRVCKKRITINEPGQDSVGPEDGTASCTSVHEGSSCDGATPCDVRDTLADEPEPMVISLKYSLKDESACLPDSDEARPLSHAESLAPMSIHIRGGSPVQSVNGISGMLCVRNPAPEEHIGEAPRSLSRPPSGFATQSETSSGIYEPSGPVECEPPTPPRSMSASSASAGPCSVYEGDTTVLVRPVIEPSEPESEAKSIDPPAPVLVTPAEFQTNLDTYVEDTGLEMFFPPTNTYLSTVSQNAAVLRNDPTTNLGTPQNIRRLTRLSLYHPVIYCDDSGSMSGSPMETQRQLVSRIALVATKIVPPEFGLDLYFINRGSFHNLSAWQIESALKNIEPEGGTPIGTNLRNRILLPLVYDVLGGGRRLERPLLICIITDGCPTYEHKLALKNVIVECRRYIQSMGYNSTAVRFSISQIGNDDDATRFLDELRNDGEIQDIIRCTTDRLDSKYWELRENERELESWLLKVLTNPIMERGRF